MTNNTFQTFTLLGFKSYLKDTAVVYGFHPTQFGEALVLRTPLGICGLAFTSALSREDCLKAITKGYTSARLIESPTQTQPLIDAVLTDQPVSLLLHGTPFQIKVWQALLTIPKGKVVSYHDISKTIGMPQAYRAVANAIGKNQISYLIPCHRIVRKSGALGGYRWGALLKEQLLKYEGIKGPTNFKA
jgi:AraC family transcriptional regulator of adaptative response/methylated-DNA-[protein]-cysteine methyltransferase